MRQWPKDLQRTQYEDINELLLKSHYMKKEIEELQKEIEKALEFDPEDGDIIFYGGHFWKKVRV